MQLEAIKQHMGIASLPCFLADNVPGIFTYSECEGIAKRPCLGSCPQRYDAQCEGKNTY